MAVRRRRRPVRGFTLVELMLIVALIGVIASLAIPRFTRTFKRSRAVEAYQTMGVLDRCMTEFYNRAAGYPAAVAVPNPTVAGAKAAMNPAAVGWAQLSFTPSGAYRWQYEFGPTGGSGSPVASVYACPIDHSCEFVRAFADTDTDGVVGQFVRIYDNGFRVDRGEFDIDD